MITVDVPRKALLNANQRMHWRAKAQVTATLRDVGHVHGRSARNAAEFAYEVGAASHTVYPYPYRVRAVVGILWPDNRRRDAHNLMPTIKALVDGFVSAGILTDDSDKYLVGPDLRVSDEKCDKDLACSLTFTFEEA